MSYLFYCTWSLNGAALLAILTILGYVTALAIERSPQTLKKQFYCILFVTSLVGLLFIFKFNLEIAKIADSLQSPNTASLFTGLIAPIGISYYLFKLISYVLDVYWENQPAQKNLAWLALYTSFFPQIISGPIQRSHDFFPQIESKMSQNFDLKNFEFGIGLILLGIIEKTVIADRIGVFVSKVDSNDFSWIGLLFSSYGYAFQLFTDFAGITHVALGLGYLFQIIGPENFNRPFAATNIQDFWRRWHISLTSWLTDYLFLPLRMALRNWGNTGLALSILINLLLIGIWHGAGWNYVAFGIIHGLFMIGSVFTLKKRNNFFKKYPKWLKLRAFAGQIITFHMVCFALIFFRQASVISTFEMVGKILTFKSGVSFIEKIDVGILISAAWATIIAMYLSSGFGLPTPEALFEKSAKYRWLIYTFAAIIIALLGLDSGAQFIYAKF